MYYHHFFQNMIQIILLKIYFVILRVEETIRIKKTIELDFFRMKNRSKRKSLKKENRISSFRL